MYVETEFCDNVCRLYINKPGTNSLDQNLLSELLRTIQWVSQINAVNVIVIASKLPFGFSSGLDIKSFIDNQNHVSVDRVRDAVYTSFQISRAIVRSPKVFIASIAGPVIGSAASIVLSCDLRVADSSTWFWLPDVQYGGFLADGGIELLSKLVGNSRAFVLSLTNERINLQEAYQWGLIYKIAEPQFLDEVTLTIAKSISSQSLQSMSLHKQLINKNLLLSFPNDQLEQILSSNDIQQRVKLYTLKSK